MLVASWVFATFIHQFQLSSAELASSFTNRKLRWNYRKEFLPTHSPANWTETPLEFPLWETIVGESSWKCKIQSVQHRLVRKMPTFLWNFQAFLSIETRQKLFYYLGNISFFSSNEQQNDFWNWELSLLRFWKSQILEKMTTEIGIIYCCFSVHNQHFLLQFLFLFSKVEQVLNRKTIRINKICLKGNELVAINVEHFLICFVVREVHET